MKDVKTNTSFGSIKISNTEIAKIVGDAICQTAGVAGLVDKSSFELVSEEKDFHKAISISHKDKNYIITVHVRINFPSKVIEILGEIQKVTKYVLNKKLNLDFKEINVCADGLYLLNF